MSKIVNLKTVRFKIFNVYDSWYSSWFEDINYSTVLFEDLMLKNYLVGIFYKLKIPTNYFFLKRAINKNVFIYSDLFFMRKYKKSLFKNMYKEQIFYFTYLIKYFTLYKNYYFYTYFNLNNFKVDLFFSERKIKQITFIGTSLLQKSRTIMNSIKKDESSFYLINNVYNKSFFNFKDKYGDYILGSSFLVRDNFSENESKIASSYVSFISSFFLLLTYSKCKITIHLQKEIGNFFLQKKMDFFVNTHKFVSNYYNYFFCLLNFKRNNLANLSNFAYLFFILFVFYCNTSVGLFLNFTVLKFLFIHKLLVLKVFNSKNSLYFPILDFYKSFDTVKYFKLKFYKISYVYYEGNFKKKIIKKVFSVLFQNTCMLDFINKLEYSISCYLKQRTFLIFNCYYLDNDSYPSITNSKIITDYIIYLIHNQLPLRTIFKKVRSWQLENNEHNNYLERLYFKFQTEGIFIEYLNQFAFKRYPVLGIRVECSGTAKKGTRKQKIFYGDWIKDFDSNTKSPNNTFSADLGYYQSFAIVKSSTLGIKVWVFFKTHLYNSNNVFISLISY